jgi:hypothetical protein
MLDRTWKYTKLIEFKVQNFYLTQPTEIFLQWCDLVMWHIQSLKTIRQIHIFGKSREFVFFEMEMFEFHTFWEFDAYLFELIKIEIDILEKCQTFYWLRNCWQIIVF